MQSSVHYPASKSAISLHVGNTEPLQPTFTPDLPLACTTLLLTTLNLAIPQTFTRAILSIAAFIAALANVLLLARRPSSLSRYATIMLLGFATITLVASRAVALGDRATRRFALYHLPPNTIQPPLRQPVVSALEALERSQHTESSIADVETEAKERALDETREDHVEENHVKRKEDSNNKFPGLSSSLRESQYGGHNETFIVTTHAGESW